MTSRVDELAHVAVDGELSAMVMQINVCPYCERSFTSLQARCKLIC
jgi:hypothetical protein